MVCKIWSNLYYSRGCCGVQSHSYSEGLLQQVSFSLFYQDWFFSVQKLIWPLMLLKFSYFIFDSTYQRFIVVQDGLTILCNSCRSVFYLYISEVVAQVCLVFSVIILVVPG